MSYDEQYAINGVWGIYEREREREREHDSEVNSVLIHIHTNRANKQSYRETV